MSDGRDAFRRDVAGALNGPLVILFEQDSPDKPGDRGLIGEDADKTNASRTASIKVTTRSGRSGGGKAAASARRETFINA